MHKRGMVCDVVAHAGRRSESMRSISVEFCFESIKTSQDTRTEIFTNDAPVLKHKQAQCGP